MDFPTKISNLLEKILEELYLLSKDLAQLSLERNILKNFFLSAHLMQTKSRVFYLHISLVIYSGFHFDHPMNQHSMILAP